MFLPFSVQLNSLPYSKVSIDAVEEDKTLVPVLLRSAIEYQEREARAEFPCAIEKKVNIAVKSRQSAH